MVVPAAWHHASASARVDEIADHSGRGGECEYGVRLGAMTNAGTAPELPLFIVLRKDANVSNQNLQAEATLVGVA